MSEMNTFYQLTTYSNMETSEGLKKNGEKIVNFGRYGGVRVSEIPIGYIDWFLDRKDSRGWAKRKLKWRGIFGRERVRRLNKK